MSLAEGPVLAVDVGSSSIKAAVIGTNGRAAVTSKVPLAAAAIGERVEIGTDALWDAFVRSVRLLSRDGQDLKGLIGIGITSQMAGLVMLDKEGRPVRDCIPGVDRRGTSYVAELSLRVKGVDIVSRTGCPLSGIYPASKLLCLQAEEPDVLKRTAYIGGVKEYLLQRLTGAWVTDPASASATQLYDQQCRDWWPEMLEAAGIDPGLLPQICDPDRLAGTLLPEAGNRLGLPPGLPVAVGTGDGPAANLSSGCVAEGQLCISLGTTAVARFWSEDAGALTEKGGYFRQHFGWNMYLQGFRMEGAGSRISELLALSDTDKHAQNGKLQSVLDDILFRLYEYMEPFVVRGRFQEIRPIGGGMLRESWMQDIADLFRLPVVLTEGGDSTSGAAMLVMKHLNSGTAWKNISDKIVRIQKVIRPGVQGSEAIRRRYELSISNMKGGRRGLFRS
ncbi:xylulokinase [Paenibacillus piri]|uniref:Carbohydrate kinase FGGY N-terminal domain-containing protein n=1 Tax=Paenibacillus piri TaxID=2547395 RepID=A0A4R5KES7_9BACL|nr:FGGY-family carbohydrate kinase [Paenibacillus piri]TDF92737.1 hypothetical protein E1757_28850 [Paenibacillus piri]